MKFIISKTALEMAVKNICRVINPKNALPILADILCMVDEERKTITMTGSDAEAWLTYQVALQECEGGGPFCIGADLLRDALAELTEQPLTILATTESDNRFTLKHESGTTERTRGGLTRRSVSDESESGGASARVPLVFFIEHELSRIIH